MKKIASIIIAGMLLSCTYSCKKDNYAAPDKTLQGQITDASGTGIQLEPGSSSARMKLEELKYRNPVPVYLNLKMDGSYINTKIFAGNYRIFPVEGPFFPLDSTQMQIVDVQETATVNFKVVPYVNVQWVGEPIVTTDKKVQVSFKFARNAAPTGLTQPALSDYQLFISTTQYVGNNNYDNVREQRLVAATAAMENQVITVSSLQPMKYSTTYYLRVGVRCNDSFKKFNYTTVKSVNIP